ncbi:MAG: AtpZ/AtpI family protein [Gemmatimonadaceae bacterium]
MRRPAERAPALSGTEFAGIGVQFAVTLVLFAFLGLWLDDRLHSSPWLLLLCVFVGGAAAFYSMYRRVMAAQKRDAAERSARRDANRRAANEDRGVGPSSGSAP